MAGKRVLILGGTTEARAAADLLDRVRGLTVITALAGVTRDPVRPAGVVRRGGFGGSDGLAEFLCCERIDAVLDATHPFATSISAHATQAGAATGRPILRLTRTQWQPTPGDRWHEVGDAAEAARTLSQLGLDAGAVIFLAMGRRGLAPFAALPSFQFLVRAVEPPDAADMPRDATLILARGPFQLAGESALFDAHKVACLVAKNSGGAVGLAKIEAARARGLPVILLRPPPTPPALTPGGSEFVSVEAAVAALMDAAGVAR